MTEPTRVIYDLTLYEEDGETPLLGSADVYGDVVESSFQTPDPDLPHDRPYLLLPQATTGTELDVLAGASRIGTMTARVLDQLLVPGDQRTGIVTSLLDQLHGARAVFRRYVDGAWIKLHDGPVADWVVGNGEPLVYGLNLQDQRAYERLQPLFASNHVLFGLNGASGPAINYGRLPGGTYLLSAVDPHPTTFTAGLGSGSGLWWGHLALPLGSGGILGDLGNATQDQDGTWRHNDFQVWWRPAGSPDETPYTKLRNMARPYAAGHAITLPFMGMGLGPEGSSDFFSTGTTLYAAGETEADVPTDGQAVEILVVAERITEATPFWWDGGTLGDLLAEIAAGDHTTEPPRERYAQAELDAFRLSSRPARLKLTKQPEDRRKWVEQNIYRAGLVVPSLTTDLATAPLSFKLPADHASADVLDVETIQPAGELQGSLANAVGEIEYTYLREHLDPKKTAQRKKAKRFLGITYGSKLVEVIDDARMDWERLVETPVTVTVADPAAAPNARRLVFAPATIRSIGGAADAPDGGDTQDELGAALVEEAKAAIFPRFRAGAQRYTARVTATPEHLQAHLGKWYRVRAAWLPEVSTGLRELRRFMQLQRISDPDPAHREFILMDGGVTDHTADTAVVDPGGAGGCLTGGTPALLPNGMRALVFSGAGTYNLVNSCAYEVEVPVLLSGAGGAGGVGGVGVASGGGGAGGIRGADPDSADSTQVLRVRIAALQTIPVTVGAGGTAGGPGEATVVWADADGMPLDPMTDIPLPEYVATGGGQGGSSGSGGAGGSGGGAGNALPVSGGDTETGGVGSAGQGSAGGDGSSYGGISTCTQAAGGGGGSWAAPGADAVTNPSPIPGTGGAPYQSPYWGVRFGGGGDGGALAQPEASGEVVCGPYAEAAGSSGQGAGAGGGGGAGALPGLPGADGLVVVAFAGVTAPTLEPPTISTEELTDTNQGRLCITEADWELNTGGVTLDGYTVLVEYAFSDGYTEPAEDSGDWRLAGTLTAAGCVTTPPAPTGSHVWTRARAEAADFLPSAYTEPSPLATPETPGLLRFSVEVDPATGVATARWTPNAYAGVLRLRGMIHDDSGDPSRPLPFLADVDAALGEYELPGVVPRGSYYTVDGEAWSAAVEPTSGLLLQDTFGRANGTDVGSDWTERSGDWSINGQVLAITDATNGRIIEAAGIARGAMFVQARVNVPASTVNARAGTMARFGWNGGLVDGYLLQPDGSTNEVRLQRAAAGAFTTLATVAKTIAPATWYRVQLYVKDGVQVGSVDGTVVQATDAAHDGQNARTMAFRHGRASGTPLTTYDDALVFTERELVVTGLPTGWKAKVLDGADAVVASAVESAGTATVLLDEASGVTGGVPDAGWAAIQVTDAADVEQARWTGATWPGTVAAYDSETGQLGSVTGAGGVYRAVDDRPASELVSATDLPLDEAEEAAEGDVLRFESGYWAKVAGIGYGNLPVGSGTWATGGALTFDASLGLLQDLTLENTKRIYLKDTTGVARRFVQITSGDLIVVGPTGGVIGLTLYGGGVSGVTVSPTGGLEVPGAITVTGDNILNVVRRDTADGADDSRVRITGGGAVATTRGAIIDLHGNEHASGTGRLDLYAGNVAGGVVRFLTGAAVERGRYHEAGGLSVGTTLAPPSTTGIRVAGASQFDAALTVAGAFASAGDVNMTGLPTADPGVSGRLWNDAGTLKVSP